jgi:myo-inositol-1-phosphate synthase
MLVDNFKIEGPNVTFSENEINSTYDYQTSSIDRSADGSWTVRPKSTSVKFKTDTRVPKLG